MGGLRSEPSAGPAKAPVETAGDMKLLLSSFEKAGSGDSDRALHGAADRDEVRKRNKTFETIDDVSYYKPIEQYEGIHRYDPNFVWEPQEEKKLIRKVRSSLTKDTFEHLAER